MENKLTLGSLFDGSGGFSLGSMLAGIEPIWSSEIEPFPILVTHKRLPSVKHYGDVSTLNGAELPPVDIITFGSPCFPEGTLILTEEGYLPIEEVEVGMKVLTHTGTWKKVTATGAKFGETVVLKGNHYGLECTPNHPIYSSSERKYYPQLGSGKRGNQILLTDEKAWIPAGEMKGRLWAVPNVVEALPISSPVYSGSWREKTMPPLTENLFYFIGRWLGDGWVRNTQRSGRPEGQRYGTVYICDSLDKEDELRTIVEKITDSYHVMHERTVVKFAFTSQVLSEWLTDNFGQYACGKTMPGWVFGLPDAYRQSLLEGILDSDGWHVKGKENTWKVSTVSKKLAESIRLLSEIQGYSTTVHKTEVEKEKRIEGRLVHQKDWYSVVITKNARRAHLTDDLHGWYRVRDVQPTNHTKVVYNLTVEEDNSYVADGIVVHNCQDLSIAGKRAGLHEGERSSLFFQAIRIIKEMREATHGEYPRYCVWENVPGAFSSNNGEDFRAVLEAVIGVKEEGITVPAPENHRWAKSDVLLGDGWSVAYRVLDSQYWGVPQRRARIYLVADFDGESAGEILFKSDGLSGYSAEGFRAWQRAAGAAEEGVGETGGRTDDGKSRFCVNPQGSSGVSITEKQTGTLVAQDHGHHPAVLQSAGFCTEHSAQARSSGYEEEKAPTLRAGTVPAALSVEHNPTDSRVKISEDGIVQTLCGRAGTGGNNVPLVAEPQGFDRYNGSITGDVTHTLDACEGNTVPMAFEPTAFGIGKEAYSGGEKANFNFAVNEDVCPTLQATGPAAVAAPESKAYGVSSKSSFGMLSDNPHAGFYEAEISRTLDQSGGNAVTSNQGGICILSPDPVYALQGSMIGRAEKNGPQGDGVNEDVSFTLNTVDHHAVAAPADEAATYSATTGSFMTVSKDVASPVMARDYKDPQIVNDTPNDEPMYIVRRLTPTECARLQGFPDWWCRELAIQNPAEDQVKFWMGVWHEWQRLTEPDKKPKTEKQVLRWLANPYSSSAEYKLWGNGLSLPIAYFVLSGIVWAAGKTV